MERERESSSEIDTAGKKPLTDKSIGEAMSECSEIDATGMHQLTDESATVGTSEGIKIDTMVPSNCNIDSLPPDSVVHLGLPPRHNTTPIKKPTVPQMFNFPSLLEELLSLELEM